uniref:Uncharacterized protein n=2 Tax=Avena sativa TaxID=4498 RepID=A0ACD6A2X1_AVESA
MMDPTEIAHGADPIPSNTAFVDAKRMLCSTMPADPISKARDDDNPSLCLAATPPLDDENLLQEILLRLPALPSSLPRASVVCQRWRTILSDPGFLTRFRKHHRKPPLLGFFAGITGSHFVPFLDTKPDRIPAERFALWPRHWDWYFMGCRHGLAVLINRSKREAIVWDPLSARQHRVTFPPGLQGKVRHAAVLCADAEDGHVHGDCFSSPFKLVLASVGEIQTFACLYESTSGVWRNIVSTVTTDEILRIRPSILIGNALFWLLRGGGVLVFDTERQSLGVIEKPVDAHINDCFSCQLLRTDDSALGFAVLSELSIQLWKRKLNCDGVVEWVLLQKIVQLEELFPLEMYSGLKVAKMVGYDEDSNVIVLATYIGDFMLQLESMQFRTISKRNCWSIKIHYPYRNFYTAVRGNAGGGGGGAVNLNT